MSDTVVEDAGEIGITQLPGGVIILCGRTRVIEDRGEVWVRVVRGRLAGWVREQTLSCTDLPCIECLLHKYVHFKTLDTVKQGQHHNGDRPLDHHTYYARSAFTHLKHWRKLYDCSLEHFTTSQWNPKRVPLTCSSTLAGV